MISYLMDTDWVIDFLRGKREVSDKLEILFDKGIAVSSITLCELYDGIYGSEYKDEHIEKLHKFLKSVSILDINDEIGVIFGKQRADSLTILYRT